MLDELVHFVGRLVASASATLTRLLLTIPRSKPVSSTIFSTVQTEGRVHQDVARLDVAVNDAVLVDTKH
jgi:hypothetical protein